MPPWVVSKKSLFGGLFLLVALLAWPAVPLVYSLHGMGRTAAHKTQELGLHHHRAIKFKMPCSTLLSASSVIVYRTKQGDSEEQGRMCNEFGKWVWYPSTNDMNAKVELSPSLQRPASLPYPTR